MLMELGPLEDTIAVDKIRSARRRGVYSIRGLINKGLNKSINRAYHSRFGLRPFNIRGIDIFDEDWDNLIILDACRYDTFLEYEDELPGETESRISRGSHTKEFIRANFKDKQLHDVVYLSFNTAFPYLESELNTELYRFAAVQECEDWDNIFPNYPEILTKHAKEFAEKYKNKRLIVHYMQPHSPYIGEFGQKHFSESDYTDVLWRNRNLNEDHLWKAYRENIEITLPDIKELFDAFQGKTVVTGDHGELLGDRSSPIPVRDYGHPYGVYTDKLIKVPWHIYNDGQRKRIVPEDPEKENEAEIDEEYIKEQFRKLGYI